MLTPLNSKIEFIGTHFGDRPDPRTGGFERFSGEIQVDSAAGAPKSITVEIETDSLWTQISKLTTHLKSVDFFEVRQYPSASFQSTSITAADAGSGEYLVTGNLTLHGVTKEIRFPAMVSLSGDGFVLRASFTIDRTEFEIAYDPGRVDADVSLTVVVGEPTQPQQAQARSGGRGGGGGGFDPAQFFARSDANGDGKLTGDEISERMREGMVATDTDGDGAISLDEFQERMRSFRGGGRGGPGR
jgi:polyisoprenoid-binding protein YceI